MITPEYNGGTESYIGHVVDWKQMRWSGGHAGGAWRFRTALLALLTLTLVALALINLHQLWVYRQPTDGVLWQRSTSGLEAAATTPGSALQRGDILAAIAAQLVSTPAAVAQRLYASGIGARLDYTVLRGGRLLTIAVPVRATRPPLDRYAWLECVGALYLAIGLFVFYRRRTAPLAVSFYLFCLASFALFCFHFTGKLNLFDQSVFWINEAALLAAPCLLLDFAWRFRSGGAAGAASARQRSLGLARLLRLLVYAPAILLGLAEVALATGAIWLPVSVSAEQGLLDRGAYLLFAAYFIAAAALFYGAAGRLRPRLAPQARIMARGTVLAIAPFLLLYIIPYVLGSDLPRFASVSVLSLILVPLAFAYAIWRHHLLEAEIVFRRGIVYTLATVLVVAAYWGVIGLAGVLIHSRLPTWGWAGWLLAIVVTALLFEPVKRWLQERLDRGFYRERYDYRRTLMDFGRQINAQPDQDTLLTLVPDRLARTLEVEQVALFVAPGPDAYGGFTLARARCALAPVPDLAFLDQHFHAPAAPRLFSESGRGLGMHYFLPCQRQGRTVAVIGLGKTAAGEYLSSDDLELVETLAGYLAIAIENARLYDSLRHKADEVQRLKDFNENIVESMQVGVVATDLPGRVESWNARMEALSGLPRARALGQPLAALLGDDFAREFSQAIASGGIHAQRKFRMSAPGGQAEGVSKIVNLAVAPLVTARYQRVGHIVLLSDVTAEVEMEQRLIQADRLRSVGLLAAGVAHEVNTPLAVISSYAQLLAKQTPASDPRAPVLDTITRQTFRASEIVANLLNFSRTGAAQFNPVEINAVVRDTLALVEHPLRSAGIHVITALHPEGVRVQGDSRKLQQVFLNLILNARDAMPRGGALRLSTGAGHEGTAWIEISDTGEGIAPELHHRIFDPFFTTKPAHGLDPSRAASMSTGTGLGLAVTYGIVEEHGGSIQVQSEPGLGAAFRIELPAYVPEPAAAPAWAV